MAKLEGVKTLDMIGGQITKVGYDGAIYERDRAFDGSTDIGNLLLCTDAPFTWFTKGAFYEVKNDTSAPVVDNVGSTPVILKTKFDIFRKVSESSTPIIEQVDAKVDALAERVTKLEGEKKDESTPKTVKRQARVGERILITDAGFAGGDPTYKNGDILTVKSVGDWGKDTVIAEEVEARKGPYIYDKEYEVIVEEESKPAPTFKTGDVVRIKQDRFEHRKGDVKIIREFDEDDRVFSIGFNNLDGSRGGWDNFDNIEKISDKEAKFAKLDRKPGEFKKGDIVRLNLNSGVDSEGTVVEIASDKARTYIGVDGDTYLSEAEWFELIAPVESRVDLDE